MDKTVLNDLEKIVRHTFPLILHPKQVAFIVGYETAQRILKEAEQNFENEPTYKNSLYEKTLKNLYKKYVQ